MKAWRAFRALSAGDHRLVAEAALLLFLVSFGVSLIRFRTLRDLLRRYGGSPHESPDTLSTDEIRRIAWAVSAASRRLPVRTTCLVEALAADAMLGRRGFACELRFSVQAQPPGPPGRSVFGRGPALVAHAWIEHRGEVVLGQLDNLIDYAVLPAPNPDRHASPRT